MKNLHIIVNDKFTDKYIQFINEKFEPEDHYFLVVGRGTTKVHITKEDNVIEYSKIIDYLRVLVLKMNKANKVILHGLYSSHFIYFLCVQPWLLKKCYWAMWGGDLYYYETRGKTIKSNIYEYLRRFVIKKMGGFITHIKGDYELAKKWYGVKGQYYYSFMYPSNLYKEYPLNKKLGASDRIYIQIGNSADSSNNHLEVLEKLQIYKHMDIEIICPLSYGDKVYAKKVINKGKELFGDKFIPIVEFMPFDNYLDILAKIDIAIFNHKRQQAMGNITTLLGLGKKVYIREEITTWQFCIDHDLKVYSANGNYDDLFEAMDEVIKQKNIENIKSKFSEEKLVEDLKKIFDEEIS